MGLISWCFYQKPKSLQCEHEISNMLTKLTFIFFFVVGLYFLLKCIWLCFTVLLRVALQAFSWDTTSLEVCFWVELQLKTFSLWFNAANCGKSSKYNKGFDWAFYPRSVLVTWWWWWWWYYLLACRLARALVFSLLMAALSYFPKNVHSFRAKWMHCHLCVYKAIYKNYRSTILQS